MCGQRDSKGWNWYFVDVGGAPGDGPGRLGGGVEVSGSGRHGAGVSIAYE